MNDLTNEKNRNLVEDMRKRFMVEAEANPQLYHRIDIGRVQSEDWQIERFILDTSTEEEAMKALLRAMQWKNSFGLHERNDSYFPKEFFLIFGHEKYSRDKEGRLTFWVSHKNYPKSYQIISQFSPVFHQFLANQIEKLDTQAGNKGWATVGDCTGLSLINVDMASAKFRIDLLNYYPKGLKVGLNVDMPWLLVPVFKIMKNFMNKNIRETVVIIKRDQLPEYFDIDSIPVSFGGKRKCDLTEIRDLKLLHELKPTLGLTDKQIETFYKTFEIEINLVSNE